MTIVSRPLPPGREPRRDPEEPPHLRSAVAERVLAQTRPSRSSSVSRHSPGRRRPSSRGRSGCPRPATLLAFSRPARSRGSTGLSGESLQKRSKRAAQVVHEPAAPGPARTAPPSPRTRPRRSATTSSVSARPETTSAFLPIAPPVRISNPSGSTAASTASAAATTSGPIPSPGRTPTVSRLDRGGRRGSRKIASVQQRVPWARPEITGCSRPLPRSLPPGSLEREADDRRRRGGESQRGGTTATPQGDPPVGILATTRRASASTTDTSPEGPFAT